MNHNLNKTLYTLLLIIISIVTATAQTKSLGKITGLLLDAQNKPMEYTTVSLLKAKDSSIV
ncbi:MAG: hypothetical protein JWQ06_1687, partial [Mucilaginibacter sp.]|nr:hypothetical protein [Mucilaginibacter sp.]